MSRTDDRFDVIELISRLNSHIDNGQFDALADIFTENATVSTPGGTATGHAAIIAQASVNHHPDRSVWHSVANHVVLFDGDTARVDAKSLTAFADDPRDPTPFLFGGSYVFTARHDRDGWRLTSMTATPAWSLNRPTDR